MAAGLAVSAGATTYMDEKFEDGWESRWTTPTKWKEASELGEWKHTGGKYNHDESDKGIQTGEDAKFYGTSAKMSGSFNNKGKDLVVQFSVKHDQKLDCGGAYLKLLPGNLDQDSFGGDSEYSVMFGPDVCGSTKRTHVIFNYKGENLLKDKEIRCETDSKIHLYTLIVKPDNTYVVQIDGEEKASGNLADDWKFLAPKEIKDPNESKPSDWVDERRIPDPEDVKPEGYDDIPQMIPDEEAEQPEDWDEEDDGEWEPPMLPNPEYKGPWTPKMIDNPDYKGPWEHPMIANPDFVDDPEIYNVCKDCQYVGFELWQVKSGSIFDDILVTDDVAAAESALEAFKVKQAGQDAAEKEQKEKEKAEAEAAKDDEEDDEDPEDSLHEEL